MTRLRLFAIAVLLACGGASAHDTWFEALPRTPDGQVVLALGTGTQYPGYEFRIGIEQVARSGCRDEAKVQALRHVEDRPAALVVRTAGAVAGAAALTCWAQLIPFDIVLEPRIVDIYLAEIQASDAVRTVWADRLARGVAWTERYVKHARIELGRVEARDKTMPLAMGMDVLIDAPRRPLRRGDEVSFVVLRDGQPLPGLAVQLRSELSPLGIWRKTDDDGRVTVKLPLAGRWILRGTDVRPSTTRTDEWDSRFVTLAFEVRD